jgi:pilus assembly protein Flp/PilA
MGRGRGVPHAREFTIMQSLLRNFWRNESGATAIEYGLIAAILGLGIIASLTQVRQGIFTLWQRISNGLNT